MNIGMNGVLVLHHSFLMLLISVFFSLLCIPFFSLLPKTEDTPIPREFSFSTFQIPNPFKLSKR